MRAFISSHFVHNRRNGTERASLMPFDIHSVFRRHSRRRIQVKTQMDWGAGNWIFRIFYPPCFERAWIIALGNSGNRPKDKIIGTVCAHYTTHIYTQRHERHTGMRSIGRLSEEYLLEALNFRIFQLTICAFSLVIYRQKLRIRTNCPKRYDIQQGWFSDN